MATRRKNFEITARTIQAAVFDAWNAGVPTLTLGPENPTKKQVPADSDKAYGRCHVRFGSTTTHSLGNFGDNIRIPGVVMVQVFVKVAEGTYSAHRAADALDVLSNTQIQSVDVTSTIWVTFRTVSGAMFGGSLEGFEQFNIEVPFHSDSRDPKTFFTVP